MKLFKLSVLAGCISLAEAALAATPVPETQFLTGNTVGSEVLNLASPGQLLGGNTPYLYNTINDTTGAKLVADNGDVKDFTLSGNSAAAALGAASVTLSPSGDSGRVRANHGFTATTTSNNRGAVNSNTFELIFNSNLSVTNATFNFSSLNTAGVSWEYSVIQLLDAGGNPFSAIAPQSWTLGAASQYNAAGAGYSGQAGIGNFIAASTGTVTAVGTAQTVSGDNGARDNIGSFNYGLVGLTAGTQIGGVRWTTYLEDVRGTNNQNSNFTSSLLDFNIAGAVTPVPEASTYAMFMAGLTLIGAYRARRQQKTQA